MSAMDQREQAFEKRSAVNAEHRFKIESRRHSLCGKWIAQVMGYDEESATRYAQGFVAEHVGVDDDESLFSILRGALLAASVDVSDNLIRQKMIETRHQARGEFLNKREA